MVTPLPEMQARIVLVNTDIHRACERVGRDPRTARVVAVSKAHPAKAVQEATWYGLRLFGESYVQEWQAKAEHPDLVAVPDLRWSFIGRLQRNKVRFLIGRVACIESVDTDRLAQEISRRAADRGTTFRQSVLLQINTNAEPNKSGFRPSELMESLPDLLALPGLSIDGLMHIPAFRSDPEATRPDHVALRTLRDRLQDRHGHALPELSMGMSSDFVVAVEEGATRVRVGTGIFGTRPPRD